MGKNEKTWKPGQSGNPNGAPKKENSITHILAQKLDKDAFTEKLIELALTGDIRAIQMVYERMDGKMKEELQVEGIEIVFNNKSKKDD